MQHTSVDLLALATMLALAAMPQGRGRGDEPAPKGRGGRGEAPKKNEDLASAYFSISDYDENGWVSFSEAAQSMRIDRAAFAVFDQDRDGRISRDEFVRRYQQITTRGGAFAPPVRETEPGRPTRRTPAELLEAYDKNDDDALDEAEIASALADHSVSELDAKTVLTTIDRDGSRAIEKREIAELVEALTPSASGARRTVAKSVEELFGKKEAIEERAGQAPGPARIQGPASAFWRLDFDQDGLVSTRDLVELQRPIQIPIRVNAVIATLDRDGDGAISAAELEESMRVR